MQNAEQLKNTQTSADTVELKAADLLESDLIDRIAHLARLDPSAEERKRLQAELEHILTSFRKLSGVDTTHVEPVYHPQDLFDCLREDQTASSFARDRLLASAGQQKDGFFVAPRTLE